MSERLTHTFASQGDIWPCLEIFLVVTGGSDGTTGTWRGESGDGTEHPAVQLPITSNFFGAKISIMIRNPTLEDFVCIVINPIPAWQRIVQSDA